jgi:class 3 adenylate cyclase/tetratricopeptide (TPR) repeat protein
VGPAPIEAARSAEVASARKVVTIVFADLAGSTALQERLDAESVRRFMDAYYQAMRGAVEAHGGTVTQLLGDGVKAVFGAPRVAEDDAIRAVRAAVAMQAAFADLARQQADAIGRVGLRVAVNTGEVIASDAAEIIGDPVNVAARLQEQARDGDVVIGESTRRLVSELVTLAPLGLFTLKGRSESVAAHRVVSLERPAGASATPFVGREDELRQLFAVYEAAATEHRARLAVVLGSPGLGKSRVIGEVARRLGNAATVLSAHCDAAGGATFAPIADALRACLRVEDADAGVVRSAIDAVVGSGDADHGRIASGVAALLAGTPASTEETFFAVRRFLGALAGLQPVVLVIDDLQWAEPLLLDLTEHLVQWSTEVPLLVLVAARPELREARSSLASPGGLVSEVVTLLGLDALAAMKLAANAIGAEELPAAVVGRVLATSEGNPLFVGELVRMLVQDGTLVRDGNRWKVGVELAGLEMPPTIQALLAARIERLRPEERTVLERAAVIGRQFSRAAVKELLPREIADFDRLLEALRRSELVEPDPGWFLGEPALRFHHVLIRDAAYRRLLKNTRAELHERFADWVETRVGEAAAHDETLGWHLEQAHRHLRELGPLDAHGRALGERAANVLAEAGRRALARDDVPVAASLLGRALAALDASDPARAELALDWCEALLAAGEVGEAAAAIDELARFAGDSSRLRAWHTCFVGERAALTDPQALRATVDAVAAAAEQLAAAGDTAGEAKAHFVHAIALSRLGRVGACEAALDRALAAARRGPDHRRRANAVLSGAPQAALWGPSPVTRASGRCLDVVRVLRITQGSPAVEAIALRCQGVLEALRGRSDAARRMIATSRRMVEELGITQRLLEAEMFAGQIQLIEGDAAAAERRLRPAYEGLREQGLGIDAAQAAALLGRALLAQGRAAEAEALSHESEALAGDDLRAAVAWRGVRAEALARRGEHAAAIELARAAVEIAAATDALLDHADARTALAAALRAAGRASEAAAEDARAIGLWEAKGATLLVERARSSRAAPIERAPVARIATPARHARVLENYATLHVARVDQAVAARDFQAVTWLLGESGAIDHTSGRSLTPDAHRDLFRWIIERFADGVVRNEPVATLGSSLALASWRESGSQLVGEDLPIGPFEFDGFVLIEADSEARATLTEIFAPDKLGDAVARLYERYAEQLPAGPARDRAAAIARSVATVLAPLDPDRWVTAISPSIEWAHQGQVSAPSGRGAETLMRGMRGFYEVGETVTQRTDEILALRPNALVRLGTSSGTDRAEDGAWERFQISLYVFGADGLIARFETFEPDHSADALARFDALTAEPAPVTRRMRPNTATAHAERLEAAMASRDSGALLDIFPEGFEVVDHTTGAIYDRHEMMATLRSLLAAREPRFRAEPLATLGDSLALFRVSTSGSGLAGGRFDTGDFHRVEISFVEVDSTWGGRHEIFASGDLGDAILRLYERYAERLPAGPERERAAATARSVGTLREYPDCWAFAPDIEVIDHRSVGHEPVRGRDAVMGTIRAMVDLIEPSSASWDDVLALRPDALLTRRTHSGIDRASGGRFERAFCALIVFGNDGLVTRWERFDDDRAAAALARFDALTAEPARRARRVRQTRATQHIARVAAAFKERDADAFPMLIAGESEMIEHTTGAVYDRSAQIATMRVLLGARDLAYQQLPVATLGDSLVLSRISLSASGTGGRRFDVGAYSADQLTLTQVDAEGRARHAQLFAGDRLGDAVVRLYERYAELSPAGPERDRAAATAHSVAATVGPIDLARSAPTLAPDLELVDHRSLIGIGSAKGTTAILDWMRTLLDVAEGVAVRFDDVLDLRPELLLTLSVTTGTDRASGGAFERQFLSLIAFGADGRMTRWEQWDVDRPGEALARVDELTAAPARSARRVRPNDAIEHVARLRAAIARRDADAFAALAADDLEVIDHPNGAAMDRRAAIQTMAYAMRATEFSCEPLATLGRSLALCLQTLSAPGFANDRFDVGPYTGERFDLIEVDAARRHQRSEIFARDQLGEAIVRLYQRHSELLPDGPERERAAAIARTIPLLTEQDRGRFGEHFAPDVEFVDHRAVIALPPASGAAELLRRTQTWYETVEEYALSLEDVLDLRTDGLIRRMAERGRVPRSGGSFEGGFLVMTLFDAEGRLARMELFDPDHGADALARFDELTASDPRRARSTA